MKIAIPNDGNMINQHFGMSKSFVIVTVENKKVESVEEISSAEFTHQHENLANLLVNHGTELVIAGGIGAGAIAGLQQKGLKVVNGASGEYMKAVDQYINGRLEDKNIVCSHHGQHHNH